MPNGLHGRPADRVPGPEERKTDQAPAAAPGRTEGVSTSQDSFVDTLAAPG